MSSAIRNLTENELDNVSGGNPVVVGIIAGFLLQGMADKLAEETGLFDSIDVSGLLSKGKGKQKPA